MGWSLQRGHVETHDLVLMLLPLLLIIGPGLAALEHISHRGVQGFAMLGLVVFSLIFFNNIFIATVFTPGHQLKGIVAELELDRSLVRKYLIELEPDLRSFTSPQDVALQWQVAMPASTQGIGPQWSLNQQALKASWATRTLGLPVGEHQVCAQLTASSSRYLVWRRTDRSGPNSEDFLLSCLAKSSAQWEDISEMLHLRTGQFRVFQQKIL
jgi:hypothetical protein